MARVRAGEMQRGRRGATNFRGRLLALAVVVAASVPVLSVMAAQSASASQSANFVGTWKVSGGYLGFTIKAENRATGACAGITASSLYHLIGCRVTGSSYVFTITEGSYRSHNAGTIEGNRVVGHFTDSNGTAAQYTAVK